MGDPHKPRKGQFQPGNKMGKGRPKGAENKFGPNLREKLLAGIAASGEKKARKNGVNGKVDGTSYFVEALMENTAAASALLSKLIPAEAPPIETPRAPAIINISSVASGQQFSPGTPDLRVLMPFDEARACWAAYNGGCESWAAYLVEIEGHLTRKAFENLSRVPPLERAKFSPNEVPALLQLVPKAPADTLEAQLGAQLDALPREELLTMTVGELMARAGVDPKHIGPDDAA